METKKPFKNMLVVGGGGFLAQIIQVASTPIITRIYSPEDYATWAILISLIAIFSATATLRFELAIVLPDTKELASSVFLLALITSCASAIFSIPIVYLAGPTLVGIKETDIIWQWTWAIPILVFVSGLYQACTYWFIREKSFKTLAVLGIWLTFITSSTQVLYGFVFEADSQGLILGTLVGQFCIGLAGAYLISKRDGWMILKRFTIPDLVNSFRVFKTYPKYMTPYTVMGVLRERLTIFFFNSFGTSFEVGKYAFSARIANLPVNLVSNGVRPILYQSASSTPGEETEDLIVKVLNFIVSFSVPIWILVLFEAETIFAFVFGESWRDAGLYGALLSIPAMILLISNWMDRLFDVNNRQRLAFGMEVVFSLVSILSFLAGYYIWGNILDALVLQVIVLTTYYVVWLVVLFKIANFSLFNLYKVAQKATVLGLVFTGGFILIRAFTEQMPAILIYAALILVYFIIFMRNQNRLLNMIVRNR